MSLTIRTSITYLVSILVREVALLDRTGYQISRLLDVEGFYREFQFRASHGAASTKLAVKSHLHPQIIPFADLFFRADLHRHSAVPLPEVCVRRFVQPFRALAVPPVDEAEHFRHRLLETRISAACLNSSLRLDYFWRLRLYEDIEIDR